VGNPKNHAQRRKFAAMAAKQPELLAFQKKPYIPLSGQVEEWACLVDIIGLGFSARVPLLLHSGRVVLQVNIYIYV